MKCLKFSFIFLLCSAHTSFVLADIASQDYVERKASVSETSNANVGKIAVYAADGSGQKIAAATTIANSIVITNGSNTVATLARTTGGVLYQSNTAPAWTSAPAAVGGVFYAGSTNGATAHKWTGAGTAGQVLTWPNSGSDPIWTTVQGGSGGSYTNFNAGDTPGIVNPANVDTSTQHTISPKQISEAANSVMVNPSSVPAAPTGRTWLWIET